MKIEQVPIVYFEQIHPLFKSPIPFYIDDFFPLSLHLTYKRKHLIFVFLSLVYLFHFI